MSKSARGVDYSTPVVVLQTSTQGSLAIFRTLGRMSVPAYAVHHDTKVLAASSRYCRAAFPWDLMARTAEESVRFLLDIGRKLGKRSILIPTSDDGVLFITGNADALREWFIFPCQPSEMISALCSKKELFFLAKKLSVPSPDTIFPENRQQVLEYAANARFPVMLKGIYVNKLARRTGERMVVLQNREELLHYYDLFEDPSDPNLMVQEYIPGGDDSVWMFNGYLNHGSECLLAMTGRKIRQTPIYRGSTSLGMVAANPAVQEQSVRFLSAVGYQGPVDIDYRYDCRDGQYKVLDVNPRVGATFRLFSDETNMDVVRAMYLDLTGQPVPPVSPVEGRKWLIEDSDLMSSIRYHQDGNLRFGEWLKSLRGVQETAFFAWDDPVPFCRMVFRFVVHVFSGAARKLISRLGSLVGVQRRQSDGEGQHG